VPADDIGCQVIAPELGVLGTQVIDAAAGTIYLIAETKESQKQYVFRLHAIDVASGAEQPGSPVVIQPPGFVPLSHKQRTGLLLSKGVVYSSWGSNCDLGNYHGWVLAHDAKTLKPVGVFNDSPDGNASSFWNGGAGPAADADGNIYVVSANGDFWRLRRGCPLRISSRPSTRTRSTCWTWTSDRPARFCCQTPQAALPIHISSSRWARKAGFISSIGTILAALNRGTIRELWHRCWC
jgi:hypothetical protein